jgi:Fe-Mn family superoxide dismutase
MNPNHNTGHPMPPAMALALMASFGSVERWRDEFVAMGKALGGGSGQLQLVFQPHTGALVNRWAADPDQALAGGLPLLALDWHPHAPHQDVDAAADRYVEAFLGDIRWPAVYERYQQAVHDCSEAFGATPAELASGGDAFLIDVRRDAVFHAAPTRLAGSHWRNPATVAQWANDLPTDRDIVVYCIHGHEVGRATAMRLRAAGLNARYLHGGLDGWQAAGLPLEAKAVGQG